MFSLVLSLALILIIALILGIENKPRVRAARVKVSKRIR